MTPYFKVYEAFLARILEDEWQDWLIEEAEADWRQILEAALPLMITRQLYRLPTTPSK